MEQFAYQVIPPSQLTPFSGYLLPHVERAAASGEGAFHGFNADVSAEVTATAETFPMPNLPPREHPATSIFTYRNAYRLGSLFEDGTSSNVMISS